MNYRGVHHMVVATSPEIAHRLQTQRKFHPKGVNDDRIRIMIDFDSVKQLGIKTDITQIREQA